MEKGGLEDALGDTARAVGGRRCGRAKVVGGLDVHGWDFEGFESSLLNEIRKSASAVY